MRKQPITIIGAGLAGSLLAIYLAKRGFRVEVYERRPDMRKTDISAGKSINLALSTRGIFALQEVGLAETVLAQAIPMRGRMIHDPHGELTFQPYGKAEHEVINSVSRRDLNVILMDAAESYPEVRIHFQQRCLGIDFDQGEVLLKDEVSGETRTVAAPVIFGCDGAYSAVRLEMQKRGRFNLHQFYLEHGYKELTIPPGPEGKFLMEKNALHIWPRHTYMLIALPNLDGSFTCTLFLAFEGEPGFAVLDSPAAVETFFRRQFPDAVPLMPTLVEDFFRNPTGDLVTIKCFPWHVGGRALLIGDAAHAIVPFYGQGMNCAFEDCTILNQCIEEFGDEWERVFREYAQRRKEDTDAIADLAIENFIEMRDRVADPKFRMKKELELRLERQFPGRFISKYAMVTFSRLPYSLALRKGRAQEAVLWELCQSVERLDDLQLEEVFRVVQERSGNGASAI